MPLRMLTVSPLQRQPHFSARTAIFQKQKIPPSHQVNVRRVKNKVPYSQIGRETMTETLSPPAGDKHHKKVYTHVSNRKSRTSCATCKTRRLKCDGTKPDCLRCLRFEGHCDGYPTPKQKSTSSKSLLSPFSLQVRPDPQIYQLRRQKKNVYTCRT